MSWELHNLQSLHSAQACSVFSLVRKGWDRARSPGLSCEASTALGPCSAPALCHAPLHCILQVKLLPCSAGCASSPGLREQPQGVLPRIQLQTWPSTAGRERALVPPQAQAGTLLCSTLGAFIALIGHGAASLSQAVSPGNEPKEPWVTENQGVEMPFLFPGDVSCWKPQGHTGHTRDRAARAGTGLHLLCLEKMERREGGNLLESLACLHPFYPTWNCSDMKSHSVSLVSVPEASGGIFRDGVWDDKVFAGKGESFPQGHPHTRVQRRKCSALGLDSSPASPSARQTLWSHSVLPQPS